MKSIESERFKAITFNHRKGDGVHDKSDKKQQRVEGVQPEVDATFSNFSIPIFSSTEFSILRISCGSHKTHPRGILCVCYSNITRSKVKFCQRGLLVPVYLCVKVNAKIAENSCF